MRIPITIPSQLAEVINAERGDKSVQAYILSLLKQHYFPLEENKNDKDKLTIRAS